MATTSTVSELQDSRSSETDLLISLASLPQEAFKQIIGTVGTAFGGQPVVLATPDGSSEDESHGALKVVSYTPAATSRGGWTLTAADFLNAHQLTQKYHAKAVMILGSEAQSLQAATLGRMADEVLGGGADLAMPHYDLPARAGLVNSGILYPISRALFGAAPRFPLALDLCLSARMAERLATAAQKFTAADQPDALIWPVAIAAIAGFSIAQVEAGTRALPQPAEDLNTVLALVAGSLFADVDAKAAFWQRSRMAPAVIGTTSPHATSVTPDETKPMLDAFRMAYGNLHEIWSLVLPPQSLLGLKRLSVMSTESFHMADSLWARIVYDFLLAYRLRTINRGHLLGALTPLYLAWVASHIRLVNAGTDPERHVEAVAAAFESDKPYLVSRWRWPDRFNP